MSAFVCMYISMFIFQIKFTCALCTVVVTVYTCFDFTERKKKKNNKAADKKKCYNFLLQLRMKYIFTLFALIVAWNNDVNLLEKMKEQKMPKHNFIAEIRNSESLCPFNQTVDAKQMLTIFRYVVPLIHPNSLILGVWFWIVSLILINRTETNHCLL